MKVYQDYPQLESIAKRNLVTECPCCGHDFGYSYERDEWVENCDIVVLNPTYYSMPGKCIVISSCLECGGKSWGHFSLDSYSFYDDINPEFAEILKDEYFKQKEKMEKEWKDSPCRTCASLKEFSNTYLYYNVTCPVQIGHCRSKCDYYVKK